MSDELWSNGFFEALRGIVSGWDFLKSIITTFIDKLMEFPLLTILLGICVFASVVFFGVEFFLNFVSNFDSFAESSSDSFVKEKRHNERKEQNRAEAEKRYKERKEQNRVEAEKRYKERKEQNRIEAEKRAKERFEKRYPLLKNHSFDDLATAYFDMFPERISFSYGGQTAYNESFLGKLESSKRREYAEYWRNEIRLLMREGLSKEEAIDKLRKVNEALGGSNTGIPNIDNSRKFLEDFGDVLKI